MLVALLEEPSFPLKEQKFTEFQERHKSTQLLFKVNLKLLNVTRVLLALWYYLFSHTERLQVQIIFLIINLLSLNASISLKYLGKLNRITMNSI